MYGYGIITCVSLRNMCKLSPYAMILYCLGYKPIIDESKPKYTSRKGSGRENIRYRDYQPLVGDGNADEEPIKDDDVV